MKTFLSVLLILGFLNAQGQEKLMTKKGKISFEASVPSFEEIRARNEGVSCILNTRTGELVVLALIKGFHFKLPLMEEHFNQNYLESNSYPKATFKGKIEDFDAAALTSGTKDYIIRGKMELHGKTKEVNTLATIKKVPNGVEILCNIIINTSDYGIEIPAMVQKKVSDKVTVKSVFTLQ